MVLEVYSGQNSPCQTKRTKSLRWQGVKGARSVGEHCLHQGTSTARVASELWGLHLASMGARACRGSRGCLRACMPEPQCAQKEEGE